jgi:hypothetical protein
MMVEWEPSAQSDCSTSEQGGMGAKCTQSDCSKSEQVRQCMGLQHCLHWQHFGLHWLHFEPIHLLYYTVCTGYTLGPFTWSFRSPFAYFSDSTVS